MINKKHITLHCLDLAHQCTLDKSASIVIAVILPMLMTWHCHHHDSSDSHLQTRFDLPEFLSWSRWNLCCLLSETSWSKSSTRVNCPRQKPEYSAAPPSEVNTRDLGVSSESTEASSESSFSSCPLKGLLVSSGAGGGGAESMTVFEQADHLGWV